MSRTIGAAIGLVLVVLFFASLKFEQSRSASSTASATTLLFARR